MTAESGSTTAAIADRHTGGWGYAAALTPIIFGTTYVLTTEFLPPDGPLLAALMRSLPTGLVLIIGSPIPPRRWMARFFVLSVLYASGLFPLLFIAAYRLPGGVAAVINSLSPLLVVVISVPLLGSRIRPVQISAGIVGTLGVALLVLRSDARLDVVGLVAMAIAAIMFSVATVLTNCEEQISPHLRRLVGAYLRATKYQAQPKHLFQRLALRRLSLNLRGGYGLAAFQRSSRSC